MIKDLLETNVNAHIEKKVNLSYLSWAWAWDYALRADPTATYKVETYEEVGQTGAKRTVPYMNINGTCMVWVTVTIFGKPMTCQLPVMDHRNKAVPNPDAFQVNTAIMRCMTKCLGLHGLGLYIYSGEDLPTPYEKVPESKPYVDNNLKMPATKGIGDDLSDDWKAYLEDTAAVVASLVEKGDLEQANYEMFKEPDVDDDMIIFMESKMGSKAKNAMRKFNESKKVKNG